VVVQLVQQLLRGAGGSTQDDTQGWQRGQEVMQVGRRRAGSLSLLWVLVLVLLLVLVLVLLLSRAWCGGVR
jgi:predicted nucleic acid-binding Zn ribbon protein